MSPLQPIDLNRTGWAILEDHMRRTGPGAAVEPPTDEESASASGDVNETFELPGRAVNLEDALESDESSDVIPLPVIAAEIQRDADGVVQTPGKYASAWSTVNTSQQPHNFTGERGLR